MLVEIREKEGMPHTLAKNKEHLEPALNIKEIKLSQGKIKIRAHLDNETCEGLKMLLSKNEDLFTWDLKGLAGVNQDLAKHSLNVTPRSHWVRCKLRPLRGNRRELVATEIKKHKEARFITPVRYPKWLANIVMVKKADNRW